MANIIFMNIIQGPKQLIDIQFDINVRHDLMFIVIVTYLAMDVFGYVVHDQVEIDVGVGLGFGATGVEEVMKGYDVWVEHSFHDG